MGRAAKIFINFIFIFCASAALLSKPVLGQDAVTPRSANDDALVAKGKSTVGNVCVACHANILRMLEVHKKSPAQWKDTVYSMIGRGAQVLPDEIDAVTLFLSVSARKSQPLRESAAPRRESRLNSEETGGGEGKSIFERSCQQCHDLAIALKKPASENWTVVVEKMVNYGTKLDPADKRKLIDYLSGLEK